VASDGGVETRPSLRAQVKRLCTIGFVFVLGIYLLRGTYSRGSVTFLPDYLDTAANLGSLWLLGIELPAGRWVYSSMLVIGVGGQLLGGVLGEHFREEGILAVQLLSTAGLLVLLGVTDGLLLFGVVALFGLMMYSFPPILQSLVAVYTPERSRGLGYGVTTAGNAAAGGFIGASLAGWLVTEWSFETMFAALAVIPVLALLGIGVYRFTIAERSHASLC
jgi:sugar phosphate permease